MTNCRVPFGVREVREVAVTVRVSVRVSASAELGTWVMAWLGNSWRTGTELRERELVAQLTVETRCTFASHVSVDRASHSSAVRAQIFHTCFATLIKYELFCQVEHFYTFTMALFARRTRDRWRIAVCKMLTSLHRSS